MTRAKFLQVAVLLLATNSMASPSASTHLSPLTTQAGARVVGTVADMNDARVPQAKVIIDGEGTTRIAITEEDGTYQSELPPGTYRIRVESVGFCPNRRASFRVEPSATVTLNFTLMACPLANQLTVVDGQYKGEVTRYLDPFKEEAIPVASTADAPLELFIRYGDRQKGANFVEYKGAVVSYDEHAANQAGSARRGKYQGVTATYNALTIHADKLRLNPKKLRLEAYENVVIENDGRCVRARRVVVDLKTGEPVVKVVQ